MLVVEFTARQLKQITRKKKRHTEREKMSRIHLAMPLLLSTPKYDK